MEIKEDRKMKIAQIGAGLIGLERIKAIDLLKKEGRNIELIGVFDPYLKDTENFKKKFNVNIFKSIENIFKENPDWIFIAVPHDIAVEYIIKALNENFKVLVEKPLGRSLKEAQSIYEAIKYEGQLFMGCNYRFFDGINKLITDINENKFGKIISINLIIGHGSDPDIVNTWKLNDEKAGGGCLIDPGIHLIDLMRIFAKKELKFIGGNSWKGFWNTGIEENINLLLNDSDNITYNLEISITKWRSTFRIEVNGTDAYGIVEGRGRSYGPQKYIFGKRWGWLSGKSQKESEELIIETNGDNVFYNELKTLLYSDSGYSSNVCTADEAIENMKIIDLIREKLALRRNY